MSDPVDLLPGSIRVAHFDVRIEAVENLGDDWGIYYPTKFLIQIQRDCGSKYKVIEVVIHEITHAIWSAYGMEEADNEERMVTVQSIGWTQVLRDNPALVAWLTGRLEE